MDITCFEQDKTFVVQGFREGNVDFIDSASEVEETEFFKFIQSRNYLEELAKTYPTPRQKEEVPTWFSIASNISMRLHGKNSFHSYPRLIRCGGMLQAFGPDTAHKNIHPESGEVTLKCAGFNEKNAYDRQTPCDQDYLRKFAKDTDATELERWLNRDCALLLKRHKVFDPDGIFIGDASYIFVPDNESYEGSVRLLFDPSGHPVGYEDLKTMAPEKAALCEWRRCYKLVSLIHTDRDRSFSLRVAIRVVPGNKHECPLFYDLFEEFMDGIGPGVVKRLILDRGFIDGARIEHVKRCHGVDVLIPLKRNMDLYADVMGLLQAPDNSIQFREYAPTKRGAVDAQRLLSPSVPEHIQRREAKRQETIRAKKGLPPLPAPKDAVIKREVAGIEMFMNWTSCGIPVHLIINRDTHADGQQQIWILIDTRPLDGLDAPAQRREEYSIRTEIEEGHRQLKCFWDLTKFTSRAFSLVMNQIVFVILSFNLLQIWLKNSRPNAPRKSRARTLSELQPIRTVIILYYQSRFALLTPLEYTELLLTLSEAARVKILAKTRKLSRTLSEELVLVRPS